jgi:hypothetical protein
METAFVTRKRFRVAPLPRLATTTRMRPKTTVLANSSTPAAYAVAMVTRLALAIVKATFWMPSEFVEGIAPLMQMATGYVIPSPDVRMLRLVTSTIQPRRTTDHACT